MRTGLEHLVFRPGSPTVPPSATGQNSEVYSCGPAATRRGKALAAAMHSRGGAATRTSTASSTTPPPAASRTSTLSIGSTLSFPSGFSRLVRLSLLRVGRVSFGYSLSSDAFPALEVIHLRSVDLNHLLSASPRLRTLNLRYCQSLDTLGTINIKPTRDHLRSLTVAECDRITCIYAGTASGLLTLRLSSALLPTYDVLPTTPLEDLYICLRGHNYNPLKQWIQELPNLTNLTVLTICSIALRVCPQCCLIPFHQVCPVPFSLALVDFV